MSTDDPTKDAPLETPAALPPEEPLTVAELPAAVDSSIEAGAPTFSIDSGLIPPPLEEAFAEASPADLVVPAEAARSLAGSYRVLFGTLTLGPQQVAGKGSIVQLGDNDARSLLAAGTVEKA